MLVVDRVVLPTVDQAHQVRELERHRTVVFDQRAQPGREATDIGDVSEDVVRGHEVRAAVPPRDLAARVRAQELHLGRNATGAGDLGHVRGRLDTEHGDTCRRKVLEEIPSLLATSVTRLLEVSRNRSTIASAYFFACATHESEYEEK